MKLIIKPFLLVNLIVLSFSSGLRAQSPETFWDKVYFGGNFGLQFGNLTVVDISPLMGYKITENYSVGISATYIYYKYSDPSNYYPDYSTNIYGGSVFNRFYFLENLFLHAEYEVLNMEVLDFNFKLARKNITSVLVGGGYRQPLGENSSINLMILYNLNEDRVSPYQNPIVRVGFAL